MAINLASKYSSKIAEVFSGDSFIKDKTSTTYDLTGVKTLKVYTPITVPEGDYERSGENRYGTPVELQDTVQELMMTQDKSFTLSIDKGNNEDQELTKRAGDILKLQIKEQTTPTADKYALKRFATMAGVVKTLTAKPTKTNIVEHICDGAQALDDAFVPNGDRFIYVTSEVFKMICLSPEFTGVEAIAKDALAKGVCGEIAGLSIVKVPTSYMPKDCYFIITHKNSVLFPYKISDAKIHSDPVGISGSLIEGRHYYDAFVLGARSAGVYVLALNEAQVAEVVITKGGTTTLTCATDGSVITYTTDGTDPRYSSSGVTYTGGFANVATGGIVKACARKEGMLTSNIASLAY